MLSIRSKLPKTGTTIFTVMSRLAKECGAINLSQGFPDFEGSPALIESVSRYMQKGFNQYAPMPGVMRLREAIAKKTATTFGQQLNTETEITVTAGATQALYTAISAFVHENDEVIIFEPAYDSYEPAVELSGGRAIPVRLEAPDYRIPWEDVKKLISIRTRMMIINSPHNPTGTILRDEDVAELKHIIGGTDIIILSDEVYEHVIFDGITHNSMLRHPDLFERSLCVSSFGKTFHNTGWKIGYCVAPKFLMDEFRKVHQFLMFSVNTPMQYALADHLSNADSYNQLGNFFQRKRDLFLNALDGSRFKPLHTEGSYFQLLDYSEISDEPDTVFAERLTKEFGIAAIPVSVFYGRGSQDKILRFCFAKKEETLQKAGELLCKV